MNNGISKFSFNILAEICTNLQLHLHENCLVKVIGRNADRPLENKNISSQIKHIRGLSQK